MAGGKGLFTYGLLSILSDHLVRLQANGSLAIPSSGVALESHRELCAQLGLPLSLQTRNM